uniref:Uncharacterized protein n=1 Tax=Sphaerodactylus townsendi TaxID=933632 RepID=A0ACB8EM65_9SAUR
MRGNSLSLPLMNHENVVQLVAAGCGGPDIEQDGLLVLTLYPLVYAHNLVRLGPASLGCGVCVQKGLLLPSESPKKAPHKGQLQAPAPPVMALLEPAPAVPPKKPMASGLHKPGVAHRDLSSQNVLVQEDQTCVISDFGLAMTLPKCHEWWRESPTEGVIRKAGAPRYNAPEILDESLNLQDLGSALRQADVYSMALVLWETLMRCSVLFPGEQEKNHRREREDE